MLRSRVTSQSRTTLPRQVREALGIRPGEDVLAWEIRGSAAIVRRAAEEQDEEDPALLPFLQLLEQDIAAHPDRLRAIPEGLYRRLLTVTDGLEADSDPIIEGAVAL